MYKKITYKQIINTLKERSIILNKYGWVFLLFISLVTSNISASTAVLNNRFGAHAVGMGGAFTAIAYGPDAIFHNWAYKSTQSFTQVKINQSSIQENPLIGLSIENPLKKRWLKLGFIYTGTSNIAHTSLNSDNQPTLTGTSFSQELFTIFSSITGQFLRTHFAARMGIFYESLENESANGFLIDLAMKKKVTLFSQNIYTGATLKNPFGNKINWSTNHSDLPPWIINIGLATTFEKDTIQVGIDVEKEDNIASPRYYAGVEYWLYGTSKTTPSFSARAGYKNSDITTGVGIKTRGWTIDYSYNHLNSIQSIDKSISDAEHRIAFGYHFGPEEKTVIIKKESLNRNIFSSTKNQKLITINGKELTIDTSSLIPKIDVAQPIQTRLLSDTNLTLNTSQNSITIQSNQLAENNPVKINISSTLNENENKVVRFPLKWIQKRNQSNDMIVFDIEKSQTAIIISGFIPEDIDLFINNQLVGSTENNNAFFEKYPIKDDQIMVFDIMIIEKF